MSASDHLSGYQFTPIESDNNSLLGADLAAMPDADHLAPTIGGLHQAHADAAAGVQAARQAYPFVTKISDLGDRATGAGHAVMRGAGRAAQVAADAYDRIEFPNAPDVEGLSRNVRGTYRPGGE